MKPINHRWKIFVVSFYFFVIVPCVLLQITARDANAATGFGSGGIVTTAIGVFGAEANALAIQSDGKLVAAGPGYIMFGSSTRFVLTRYNTDGSLDMTFGTGGIVATAIGVSYTQANALAIQSDGKLVAAGYANIGTQSLFHSEFTLVRYNTDGSLDTTFGTGGIVTTAIGAIAADANALAIQSDGKLIAAGYTEIGPPGLSAPGFALVRYNTDGSLDTTFGTGGIVTTAEGRIASAVAIQSDGKVVAAGGTALVRYNTNGSLDSTFGTGGIVMTSSAGLFYGTKALTIQSNGKLVAAGAANGYATGESVFVLIRYNANGNLDTTFGTGGIVTTAVGSFESAANALAIQSNGKLVAAGYASFPHISPEFGLARYNTNGSLDPTFGTGGVVTTSIGGRNDEANALAIQSDGKLVAAGFSSNINSQTVFALVRYDTDGSLDVTSTNTTTTTTTTTTSTTTTTNCNDQNKGKGKDKGKGHDKGKCRGHEED